MKKLYIVIIFLLVLITSKNGYTQCSNFVSNYPSGVASTTSSSLVTNTSCNYGGEYSYFNVTAGETYTWTTCADDNFDTQLTLYQGQVSSASTVLAYNDDDCGLQSTITWTATYTGVVTLLVSEYSCSSNSTCTTVQWACTSCGGGGGGGGCIGGSNNTCSNADPFCTGTTYDYCNSTNVADMGTYDCLYTTPNPIWMYLEIANSGDIDIYITQYNNSGSIIDVDFALYGPYTSLSSACPSINGSTPTVDCSYSAAGTETANIPSANAGEYYVLLITNYSNQDGYIEFSQTGGTGSTDCSIVVPFTLTTSQTNVLCNGGTTGLASVTVSGGTPPYTYNWSNGTNVGPTSSTTSSITGLSAGTYTVTVTDDASYTSTATVTITEPSAINASTSVTNESCDGANDGSIDLTVSGGTPGYSYHWVPTGASSQDISGLADGTYNVTITDANNCTQTASATVSPGPPVSAVFTPPANQCLNGNSFTFSATGSSAGTYLWDFGDGNTGTGSPVSHTYGAAGTYTVTLTVTSGPCSDAVSHNIVVYPPPSVSFSGVTDPLCHGDCNGQATASGGASYAWDDGENSATATALCAGTHTVTVTDGVGCTNTGTVTLTDPPALSANVARNDVTCNGGNNGTAQANITTASTAPYDYQWSTGASTMNTTSLSDQITGLSPGNYDVTITDANGCNVVISFTISEPSAFSVTQTHTDANCGNSDGSASVTVSGATPPYTYLWNTGATSSSISGVPAGTYTVTVSDAVLPTPCTHIETINILDVGGPAVAISSSADPQCNGSCDGSATASITTGSTAPYNYSWSNGSTTNNTNSLTDNVSGLCSGTISVTVTDDNGCSANASVTLTDPPALSISIMNITNAICGQANGAIDIATSGGTGGYTYTWSPAPAVSGQEDQTGLNANTYSVTATDTNGCTATNSATVGDNPGAVVQITGSTNPLCNGDCNGDATATITTLSTGPYDYQWSSGGSTSNTNSITDQETNLCAGTVYTVTLTDANGCTSTDNIVLTEPTVVSASISSQTDVSCNGGNDGTATVTGSGGTSPYTYLWQNSQTTQTATGLGVGTYSVTVTDNNGCEAVTTVTINEPTALLVSMSSTNDICGNSNGTATATPSGGTSPYTYLWSDGQTSATATGLTGGSYDVTVTDANGCTAFGNVSVIQQPGQSISISSYSDVTCNGGNDGQATVSISGGTAPFTTAWSSGGSGLTETGLSAGTYTVTVTDANGCTDNTSVTIGEPTLLSVTVNDVSMDCNGDCTADFTANVSGGTMPYTYQWDDAFLTTTSNLDDQCAGTYNVTVTDANGCIASDNANAIEPPAITITDNVTGSTCGNNDGAIDITVSGGTPPYTYLWDNGATTEDLTNIYAGNYCVTVTDIKGCTMTGCYIVNDAGSPTATISSSTNVDCFGNANGTATVSATGGTTPYTYLWSDGQNTTTATNLSGGVYNVIVSDNNGCNSTAYVTITEPTYLSYNLTTTDNLCNGDCSGIAAATPFGGTPPYTYQWVGGGSTPNSSADSNLCAGTYSLIITDANGCDTINNNITITEPPFLSLTQISGDETCNGAGDGWAQVTASGGVVPYIFQWDANANNQTTQTATNLSAGTYTVTVTDNNGCQETITSTVHSPNPLEFNNVTSQDLTCYLSNDGQITAGASGGTPPYSYSWTNNISGTWSSTQQNLTNLESGTYYLTITDNNGCFIDTSIIINMPMPISITLNETDETCAGLCDGTITSLVSGGTPPGGPYSYAWSNFANTANLTNVCPGTYTLTVTDNNGCQQTASTTVTGPPALLLSVTNITDATCGNNNGEIDIAISGGTGVPAISWDNGSNSTVNANLSSGNYCVTVIDANNCTADTCVGINDIGGPIITGISTVDVSCNGSADGSATVNYTTPANPALPYTIAWNTGANTATVTNLSGGNYSVTVTDTNGCFSVENTFINEPTPLNSSISNIVNNTCHGDCAGSATFTAMGGTSPYNYLWSNGDVLPNATNLCAQTYNVTITDANGCTTTNNVTINEPPQIIINLVSVQDASCPGTADGSIDILPTGGSGIYNYQWFGTPSTGSTAGQLAAGSYMVIVSDANDPSCQTDTTFTVGEPSNITATLNSIPVTCNQDNGIAYIENITGGTPPYSYTWSPCGSSCNNDSVYNLSVGTYQVQIYDSHNCFSQYQVAVANVPPPNISQVTTSDATCNGGNDGTAIVSLDGNGTPPFLFNWSPYGGPDSISNNLMAGNYTVTVTDSNGCSDIAVFSIDEPAPIDVFLDGPSNYLCIGEYANLSASANGGTPPYTFVWSDSTMNGSQLQTVQPATTTVYSVNVTDANGCTSLVPVSTVVNVYPPLSVTMSPEQDICEGVTTTVQAFPSGGNGGPYTFVWNYGTGNPLSVTPHQSTEYVVTVFDNCGTPSVSDSTYVSVHEYPRLLSLNGASGCQPVSITFYPTIYQPDSAISYLWNFGDTQTSTDSTPSHVYQYDGLYDVTLTLTSAYGCSNDTILPALVQVYPVPDAQFNANPQIIGVFDADIHFTDESVPTITQWYWDFGDGSFATVQNPEHTYTHPGEYEVQLVVSTANSCSDTAVGTVTIKQEQTFYAPTAFSPGSGFTNNYWYPKGIGIDPDNYHLWIYDRWGQVVFETDKYPAGTDYRQEMEGGWNGRYNNTGKWVPPDTYTWLIILRDVNGEEHQYAGQVTILK